MLFKSVESVWLSSCDRGRKDWGDHSHWTSQHTITHSWTCCIIDVWTEIKDLHPFCHGRVGLRDVNTPQQWFPLDKSRIPLEREETKEEWRASRNMPRSPARSFSRAGELQALDWRCVALCRGCLGVCLNKSKHRRTFGKQQDTLISPPPPLSLALTFAPRLCPHISPIRPLLPLSFTSHLLSLILICQFLFPPPLQPSHLQLNNSICILSSCLPSLPTRWQQCSKRASGIDRPGSTARSSSCYFGAQQQPEVSFCWLRPACTNKL